MSNFKPRTEMLKVATFRKVSSPILIESEGVFLHKKALWKDGQYIGIVMRLTILDDSPETAMMLPTDMLLPEHEYIFEYVPRPEIERMKRNPRNNGHA